MKKAMMICGTFSATVLSVGIMFKYLAWPGASLLMVVGMSSAALLFVPFLCAVRISERQKGTDKLLWALGSVSAMAMIMSILFKIMHWPGANMLGVLAPAVLILLFLPLYFFTGVGNAQTRQSVIISSVVMVLSCGLFFSLTVSPKGMRVTSTRLTNRYLLNEQLLKNEQRELEHYTKGDTASIPAIAIGKQIFSTCEALKGNLVKQVTGYNSIDADYEAKDAAITDNSAPGMFFDSPQLAELAELVEKYNATSMPGKVHLFPAPGIWNKRDNYNNYRNADVLADLTQAQMLVLQNEREMLATK